MNKDVYEIKFGHLMAICDHILNISIRSRMSIDDMNDIVIHLPLDKSKDFYIDLPVKGNSGVNACMP